MRGFFHIRLPLPAVRSIDVRENRVILGPIIAFCRTFCYTYRMPQLAKLRRPASVAAADSGVSAASARG
jgi:hypothetical protein